MKKKILSVLLISLSLLYLSSTRVKVAYCQTTTEDFEIESFTYVYHGLLGNFSVHGNEPWINGTVADHPTNYIDTGTLSRESGDYYFQNTPIPEQRAQLNVTNVIFHQNSCNYGGAGGSVSHIQYNFWNSTDWITYPDIPKITLPLNDWNTTSINITSIWSQFPISSNIFNNLALWLHCTTPWISSPHVTVDYAYLTVTYSFSGFSHYPMRLTIGLVGLVLIVASPSLTVYFVIQKKQYEWLITALVLFCMGYAFMLVWLVP